MKPLTQTAPKVMTFKKSKRVLAIGAHPDDTEWGCGGTFAKLHQEGAELYVLLTTDGSKGSADPKMTPKKIGASRKKEHAEANRVLGIKKAFYLDHEDGSLESSFKIRKGIVEVIRIVRPDIVFTFDPSTKEHDHSDHRITGQATLDAVYPAARDRLYYPELLKKKLLPHKVSEVFLFFTDAPNVYVDISKFLDIKVEALACHASQYPDSKEIKNNVTTQARKSGSKYGVHFAEAFRHMKMPL